MAAGDPEPDSLQEQALQALSYLDGTTPEDLDYFLTVLDIAAGDE
jgi:hypothetical protein